MKRAILFLMTAVICLTVNAEVPKYKMLEQDKTWIYIYHHFESDTQGAGEYNEKTWYTTYHIEGDTIIEGRKYMRMYRWSEMDGKKAYYGAFREDEEGRVYMYDYNGDKQDFKMFDTSTDIGYGAPDSVIAETIKVNGQLFRRYRYMAKLPDGSLYDRNISVEGVGYQKYGIIHTAFEEEDCICDYEKLVYVEGPSLYFSAISFEAPKEIELTDTEKQLIAGNNDFAFNLFRKVRGESSNIISPLSIIFALGMMSNGAAGQTLQEIGQTLGFGDASIDDVNAFCRKMLADAGTLDKTTKAIISNTIFVNEGLDYYLQDSFIKKANEFYNAQPQSRDFNDGETMNVINQWSNDHTEGMIPTVLHELTFNPWAVSYLLNALYFKGAWSTPFEVEDTREEAFGGGPTVPMMHQKAEYIYTENSLYQAIILPYGNEAYQMRVFLPKADKTIGDVLETLDGKNWKVKGSTYEIDLKLPRFETEANINLVKPLSDLGMSRAFTKGAEFPYFCNTQVFIDKMFQIAKIKLDEQGTEASAVTTGMIMPIGIPPSANFHAKRPFLYIISEKSSGTIFFIGQYTGGVSADYTNGIHSIDNEQMPIDNALYDLSGRRVSPSSALKGVYIQNGKKVVRH